MILPSTLYGTSIKNMVSFTINSQSHCFNPAKIFLIRSVSLISLMENGIEIVSNNKTKDLHLLQYLIGKTCTLECTRDAYLLDISTSDGKVLIVDVNDDWVKVQYHRTKKGSFIKKETVTKLIDLSDNCANSMALSTAGKA